MKYQNLPLSLLFILLVGACDNVGDCLAAGGRWVEEIGECVCTYEERGDYDIHVTENELEACMKPRSQEYEDQQKDGNNAD